VSKTLTQIAHDLGVVTGAISVLSKDHTPHTTR
jgi:hypothetical protein